MAKYVLNKVAKKVAKMMANDSTGGVKGSSIDVQWLLGEYYRNVMFLICCSFQAAVKLIKL